MTSPRSGRTKVAQRFIAGITVHILRSPRSGRLKQTEPRTVASGIRYST